jgi:predicted metal-dependent enzyme (double-stranded beta helix superfamily)
MPLPLTLARPRPLPAHRADLAAIAAGLASAVTGDELTLEPGQLRAYVRLLASPSYEAWLIAWAEAGSLELHDHGGSIGAVHVVGGELAETWTDLGSKGPLRSQALRAGDELAVPASRVHEVWNPGPAVALSVHVYSPPITAMTFYDRDPDRFLQPLRTTRPEVDAAP